MNELACDCPRSDAWRCARERKSLDLACTDTPPMQYALEKATAVCFIAGRLTFCRPIGGGLQPTGNSGAPSMLLGYGSLARDRIQLASAIEGVRFYK